MLSFFFFFNDTATTEIYTLSLHDALPIWDNSRFRSGSTPRVGSSRTSRSGSVTRTEASASRDRKSTRLNSSHLVISYAVFCLKKKKNRGTGFIFVGSADSLQRLASDRRAE